MGSGSIASWVGSSVDVLGVGFTVLARLPHLKECTMVGGAVIGKGCDVTLCCASVVGRVCM